MKRSEAQAILNAMAAGIKAQAVTVVTKNDRQATASLDVVKENYSISKFLRGQVLGIWDNATDEQKLFTKALSSEQGTRGGIFLPTQVAGDVIERLKETARMRNLPGVRVIPMPNQLSMRWNSVTTGPTISWGTENTAITEDTALAFGDETLELKKAVCLYKMPRELLENASTDVDDLLRTELAAQMALEDDRVVLEGGGGTEPLGFYNHPRVNSTTLSATITSDDFKNACYQVRINGYREINAWVCHPRTMQTLSKEKDGTGRYIYGNFLPAQAGMSPVPGFQIDGHPCVCTTKVAITNKPAANDSYVVGGDFSQLILGEKPGLRVETTDTGGDAFINDQVWLRLVRFVGTLLRYPTAFVVIKGVQA